MPNKFDDTEGSFRKFRPDKERMTALECNLDEMRIPEGVDMDRLVDETVDQHWSSNYSDLDGQGEQNTFGKMYNSMVSYLKNMVNRYKP